MKTTPIVGIDISADKLDVALAISLTEKPLSVFTVENSIEGIESMLSQLATSNLTLKDIWFCMEHTGNYGLLLCCMLQQASCSYSVIPALEIKQSIGMVRGKNDTIDSIRIAHYGLTQRHKLVPFVLPQKPILMLKELVSYRTLLVRQCTQCKNSIKSRNKLKILIDNSLIIEDLMRRIEDYKNTINLIEKKIKLILEGNQEIKKSFDLLKSISGIGFLTAVVMVVSTQNFTSFNDARKYSCYVGTAPFESSSGTIKGTTKVSNLANKQIKTILHNGANSAIQHDPEMKSYYLRKINEGKKHKTVANAVVCKLIYRAFAVIKRGTPYVVTYEKKVA